MGKTRNLFQTCHLKAQRNSHSLLRFYNNHSAIINITLIDKGELAKNNNSAKVKTMFINGIWCQQDTKLCMTMTAEITDQWNFLGNCKWAFCKMKSLCVVWPVWMPTRTFQGHYEWATFLSPGCVGSALPSGRGTLVAWYTELRYFFTLTNDGY